MRFSNLNIDDFESNVRAGNSDLSLAKVYGVSDRTIMRWRAQLRLDYYWQPRVAACGTQGAYARGCRCNECTRANREAHRSTVSKMKAKGLAPSDRRHGTPYAYNSWGCRCGKCKAAWAERCREHYEKTRGPVTEPWWTESEVFALRALPPVEASKRLGRSLSAVYAKRHRAGLSSRVES